MLNDAQPLRRSSTGTERFRSRELLPSWWEHRALFFIIIVSINFAAFFIYFLTFLGEGSTPLLASWDRVFTMIHK